MSKKPIAIPVRPGMSNPAYKALARALKPVFKRLLHSSDVVYARPKVSR